MYKFLVTVEFSRYRLTAESCLIKVAFSDLCLITQGYIG